MSDVEAIADLIAERDRLRAQVEQQADSIQSLMEQSERRKEYADRLRAMAAHLAVPVGYLLAPVRATPEIRQAMRTGSRKDWPSDELCDVRWAAVVAAIRSGGPLQALADNAREMGLSYEGESKT